VWDFEDTEYYRKSGKLKREWAMEPRKNKIKLRLDLVWCFLSTRTIVWKL